MRFKVILIIISTLHVNYSAYSQPSASFTISTPVCIDENIEIINTTVNGDQYRWDFCMQDLDSLPVFGDTITISGSSLPIDIQLIYESGNWYGFLSDFLLNKLYRLDYSSDLESSPTQNDLGNPGSLFNQPYQTKLYKEGGIWYGFTVNFGNSKLIRTTFGNGLDQPPTLTEDLGSLSSLNNPIGLDIIDDDGQLLVLISNNGGNKISIVDFGNSLSNTPGTGDVIEIGTGDGLDGAGRISLLEEQGNWYGLWCSINDGKVYRLKLGDIVFDTTYTIESVSDISLPEGVELVKEGLHFYGLAVGRTSGFYRIDFG